MRENQDKLIFNFLVALVVDCMKTVLKDHRNVSHHQEHFKNVMHIFLLSNVA